MMFPCLPTTPFLLNTIIHPCIASHFSRAALLRPSPFDKSWPRGPGLPDEDPCSTLKEIDPLHTCATIQKLTTPWYAPPT